MVSFKTSIVYMYFLSGLDLFRGIAFPLYARALGYSDLEIGTVLTIFTLVALFSYYPASLLAEKRGAKLALYITYLAYFVSLLGIAYAATFVGFVAAYVGLGVAQAFIIQRNTLILANTGGQKELNQIYSSANGASLLGDLAASLGVALLGFATLNLDPSPTYFRLSFVVLGALWLTPIPLIRRLKDSNRARKLSFSPQKQLLAYSTVSLAIGFGENIIVTLLQLYYASLGVNLVGISLIYILMSATGYAGTRLAAKLDNRVVAGYVVSACVYSLVAPLIGLPVIYSVVAVAAYSFVGAMRNSLGSVIRGEILRAINQVEKGYGTSSVASTLGDSAGTFLQGFLFNQGEYGLPFLIGAGTVLLGSLLNYYFYKKYVFVPAS